ncbi:MAG: nicotinate-nucleotide adenylyltransferase [Chloroflexota bacterium]|nr:nicotinate-nucleotide adenylyltransferase [Chloroflexota bacterium]
MLKLGILGGTFDPPHIGHCVLAEFAQSALALDRVLFVPAGTPPHKNGTRTNVEHRLTMLEIALANEATWAISRVDVDRPGPHYSVDMLRILATDHPDVELYFIMGGDSFRDLPTWSRSNELIMLCKLAVMERPGAIITLDMHEAVIPNLAKRSIFIDAPLIGVSSTDIARWQTDGRPIRRLLPPGVAEYIKQHGLYT